MIGAIGQTIETRFGGPTSTITPTATAVVAFSQRGLVYTIQSASRERTLRGTADLDVALGDGRHWLVVVFSVKNTLDYAVELGSEQFVALIDGKEVRQAGAESDETADDLGLNTLASTLEAGQITTFVQVFKVDSDTNRVKMRFDREHPRDVDLLAMIGDPTRSVALMIPTSTSTPVPTATPAPTNTPVPTSTRLPTSTAKASSTPDPNATRTPTKTAVPPTFTPAPNPSSSGGIGNARSDVLRHWGISSGSEPIVEFIVYGKQDLTYDSGDGMYQISLIFQLQSDDDPRASDRLVQLVIDVSQTPMTEDDALSFVRRYLPDDRERVRGRRENRFGEPTWEYSSDAIRALLPNFTMEGEQLSPPGTVFVTLYPGGNRVTVIDIALFDASLQ